MDYEELLIELRKDHEYLRQDVDEMRRDVREMRDAFIRYRGIIGGALFVASCVGAFATYIIDHLIR